MALIGAGAESPKQTADLAPSGRAEFDALLARLNHQTGTQETHRYLKATVPETQKKLMQTVLTCVKIAPDSSWPRLRIVVDIDATGRVSEARAETGTALALCLEKRWIGTQYKAPPFAPFYRLVVLEASSRKGS